MNNSGHCQYDSVAYKSNMQTDILFYVEKLDSNLIDPKSRIFNAEDDTVSFITKIQQRLIHINQAFIMSNIPSFLMHSIIKNWEKISHGSYPDPQPYTQIWWQRMMLREREKV